MGRKADIPSFLVVIVAVDADLGSQISSRVSRSRMVIYGGMWLTSIH